MALNFKAYFTPLGCSELKIKDTTGVYSTPDNTGGYGSPNPELSDFDAATLSIEMSNGVILGPFSVYNGGGSLLPSTSGTEFTLDKNVLGAKLVDGTTVAVVTMTGPNDLVVERRLTFFVSCNADCCLATMATKIKATDKCCDGSASQTFNNISDKIVAMKYLANECCNFTKATAILEQVQLLCRENGCLTC
jgi:hypothetical protein